MKINFIINKQTELENLLDEIDSRDKVLSYGLETILPEEGVFVEYLKTKNTEKVERYLTSVFDAKKYEKTAGLVKEEWTKVKDDFLQNLVEKTKLDPAEKYDVQITMYGPGGSYQLPNRIILRAAKNSDVSDSADTIMHEIIHLLIEKIVKKNKLNHNGKENLVNIIIERVFSQQTSLKKENTEKQIEFLLEKEILKI